GAITSWRIYSTGKTRDASPTGQGFAWLICAMSRIAVMTCSWCCGNQRSPKDNKCLQTSLIPRDVPSPALSVVKHSQRTVFGCCKSIRRGSTELAVVPDQHLDGITVLDNGQGGANGHVRMLL